jgi:hypothetical protein
MGIREFFLPLGLAGVEIHVSIIDDNTIKILVDNDSYAYYIYNVMSKPIMDILYLISDTNVYRYRIGDNISIAKDYFERYKEEYNRNREKTCAE